MLPRLSPRCCILARIYNFVLFYSLVDSKADLRKSLVGIGVEIQATDAAEIDYEAVLEKVKRGVK